MYGAIEDYIGDLVGHVLSTHLLLLRYARSSFHLLFSTRAFAKKNMHCMTGWRWSRSSLFHSGEVTELRSTYDSKAWGGGALQQLDLGGSCLFLCPCYFFAFFFLGEIIDGSPFLGEKTGSPAYAGGIGWEGGKGRNYLDHDDLGWHDLISRRSAFGGGMFLMSHVVSKVQ